MRPGEDRDREGRSSPNAGRKRLLAISSGGGHWNELARLSPAFDGFDVLYATTTPDLEVPSGDRPLQLVRDFSRSEPLGMLRSVFELSGLLRRFRPHVIVSTGAAPGLLAMTLGRLIGSRGLWIDIIASPERLSLSARLAKGSASLRLVQFPHLADPKRGIVFLGRTF